MELKENITKPLVIFGSSRNDGNTKKAINQIFQSDESEIIDLNNLEFSEFDYQNQNQDDDFIPLIKNIIKNDEIILATPIYWYMPSAIMKKFIDRFGNLITTHKEIGKKLKGKNLYIICSYSTDPDGKKGFEDIFKRICQYMGINYQACYFYYAGDNSELSQSNKSRAERFIKILKQK